MQKEIKSKHASSCALIRTQDVYKCHCKLVKGSSTQRRYFFLNAELIICTGLQILLINLQSGKDNLVEFIPHQ